VSGIRELLVDASVAPGAPVAEAVRGLVHAGLGAIAVVDDARRVVGLFSVDDVLRALFPRYLDELSHTAFIGEAAEVAGGDISRSQQRVEELMSRPVAIDIDAGQGHVAERFLHEAVGALAVCDGDRFVGMLDQREFVRSLVA
jgi:CBS domain-containing protein